MHKKLNSITLLNVWSEQNKGDFAIVEATIQLLKDKFNIVDNKIFNVVFIGIGQEDIKYLQNKGFLKELSKYNLYPATIRFLEYNRTGHLVTLKKQKLAKNILKSFYKLLANKDHLFKLLKNSDLIISVGGHYLYSFHKKSAIKEILSTYFLTLPYIVASKAGKKVNIFGTSFGPYYHKITLKYLRRILKHHKIFAREKYAQNYIRKELVLPSILMPDIAFYLDYPDLPETPPYKNNDYLKIAITVRDWAFPDITYKKQKLYKQKQYITSFVNAVKTMLETFPKALITFYPQVAIPSEKEDDRQIMRVIEKLLYKKISAKQQKQVLFLYSQPKLKKLVTEYRSSHVIIGTRMHSLILGIPTPFVPIAYMGKKTYGLLDLLSYPKDLLLDINEVSSTKIIKNLSFVLNHHRKLHTLLKNKKVLFKKQLLEIADQLEINK